MTKIEATIAQFAKTTKGATAEQKMLLKMFRNLPAAKQQEFIQSFARQEMARLAREAA